MKNTFANQTLPELVYIAIRDTRPVSLVNAFETPVTATADHGRREAAAEAMSKQEREIEEQYGFKPKAAFVIGLGDLRKAFAELATETTLPELTTVLGEALDEASN
ncbi:type I-E CRISPR-associated protein Cas7/Cse4/CasC [Corynebacterium glucuronolyticum]|uniref:type I-E CRISPR-associated protein Cas7/Cse4/CasC n=1 Tax=Corynebacterium glucuronolyticum TaxID=39791 RepID=UPI001F15AF96|nr:type I-E CRISPR-associated protein Cas7/Cse4/CasC [Corynebacterium glucuronolyticum]